MDEGTEPDGDEEEWVEYEPVRGELSLSADDYEAAYLLRSDSKRTANAVRKLLAACLVVVGIGAMATEAPGVWTVLLVVLALGFVFARKQHAWMGRAMFSLRPKRVQDVAEVTVDHESIRRRAARWETEYKWPLVTEWLESETQFVLLSQGGVLDVLPKRAFAESRWPELRALFEDCVESAPSAEPAAKPSSSKGRLLLIGLLLVIASALYVVVSR